MCLSLNNSRELKLSDVFPVWSWGNEETKHYFKRKIKFQERKLTTPQDFLTGTFCVHLYRCNYRKVAVLSNFSGLPTHTPSRTERLQRTTADANLGACVCVLVRIRKARCGGVRIFSRLVWRVQVTPAGQRRRRVCVRICRFVDGSDCFKDAAGVPRSASPPPGVNSA